MLCEHQASELAMSMCDWAAMPALPGVAVDSARLAVTQ